MRVTKFSSSILTLILCTGALNGYQRLERIDIRGKLDSYKDSFRSGTYLGISKSLADCMDFVNWSVYTLNKNLHNDKELMEAIDKYGDFKNQKVALKKSENEYLNSFSQYLENNGLKIGYGEGAIHLYFDPLILSKIYKNILPSVVLEYFIIESCDIGEASEEDGALIIPWDALRIKIIRYENYYKKIERVNCPYIEYLVVIKLKRYLSTYMTGFEKSRIDNYIDEAKKSYEIFLRENADSVFYEAIKGYYDDLKRNLFKFIYKEYRKEGLIYSATLILDEANKEISIYEVADKYLNTVKLGWWD